MPVVTLGSTIAAILQFIVVVGILMPAMLTHTQTGQTILGPGNFVNGNFIPANYVQHLNGTIAYLNQSYLSVSGPNSLQQQMATVVSNTASNINPGILQTLGGLAFIPSAFGFFMNAIYNEPGIIFSLFGSLLSGQGAYIVLPFSVFLISAAILSYFVIIYAMKLMTPISKVEIEDV